MTLGLSCTKTGRTELKFPGDTEESDKRVVPLVAKVGLSYRAVFKNYIRKFRVSRDELRYAVVSKIKPFALMRMVHAKWFNPSSLDGKKGTIYETMDCNFTDHQEAMRGYGVDQA